jgi:hypothetical protein
VRIVQGFGIFRLVTVALAIWLSFFGAPKPAAAQGQDLVDDQCFDFESGCDTEGYTAILASTNASEIDTYTATFITDYNLLDEGYQAYVEGYLYQNNGLIDSTSALDDGSGTAQAEMFDTVSPASIYQMEGDHYLTDDFGDVIPVGQTLVAMSSSGPQIYTISPTFGYVGTRGAIVVQGSSLIDPFTGTVTPSLGAGSGMTFDFEITSPNTVILGYTIAQNASLGPRNIILQTRFGLGTSTQAFTVGDPPPVIVNVNPDVWQAGNTIPITISGAGFGTSPSVSVSGTGVSLVSVGSVSDTMISATVFVASNAPNETATVIVQSNGYGGSGFQPAFPGESSAATFNTLVQAILAPAPQIQLYGQTITTTQSMVAGQEIALTATVNLPQGMSISSQSWSQPEGTVVGGYTNDAGNGPPDTTGGKVQGLPALTNNNSTTTPYPFTFYWVDSGNPRQITYTYTMSNGESNSATATFNVTGPTGANLNAQTSTVNILYPSEFGNTPGLQFGFSPSQPFGINFAASATLPSGNQGAYSFAQLISKDVVKLVAPPPRNSQTCNPNGFLTDSSPELDNAYPYGSATPNSTNDSPGQALISLLGELARSFAPTMYLLWSPNADGRCSSGSGCTIPVPLGSVSWHYFADGINALTNQANSTTWILNYGSGAANQFQGSNLSSLPYGYPTWKTTYVNSTLGTGYHCTQN